MFEHMQSAHAQDNDYLDIQQRLKSVNRYGFQI